MSIDTGNRSRWFLSAFILLSFVLVIIDLVVIFAVFAGIRNRGQQLTAKVQHGDTTMEPSVSLLGSLSPMTSLSPSPSPSLSPSSISQSSSSSHSSSYTTTLPPSSTLPSQLLPHNLNDFNDSKNRKFKSTAAPQMEFRVIGGDDADVVDYPYNVIWSVGCGGTLIYEDVVLSSGHCYSGSGSIKFSKVWVGNQKRRDGRFRNIQDLVRPKEYESNNDGYDISILKLEKPVMDIKPIKLNSNSNIPASILTENPNDNHGENKMTVIGFGRASETQQARFHHTLQEAQLDYITYDTCIQHYNARSIDYNLTFCAASEGKDACDGDAGNPIICKDCDAEPIQVGVTSSARCDKSTSFPGIYIRVSYFYRWIQNQVCILTENPHDGCIPIQIRFVLDPYPFENHFVLHDKTPNSNNIVILHKYLPDSVPPGDSVIYDLRLLPGSYELEVLDTYGDGMCCTYQPSGSYMLWTGTKQIVRNGDFGRYDKINFEVSSNGISFNVAQSLSPTAALTKSPSTAPVTSTLTEPPFTTSSTFPPMRTTSSPTILADDDAPINKTITMTLETPIPVSVSGSILIQIQYDNFPLETSWTLSFRSTPYATSKMLYNDDTVNIPNINVSYIFHNVASGEYTFQILDNGFNGICCDNGRGWFSITDITDISNQVPIYHSDGRFRFFDYTIFDF